jgi:hypothetical protein
MPQFRKKPVVIEARRVPKYEGGLISAYLDETIALSEWCHGTSHMMHDEDDHDHPNHILIPTLEGDHMALPGDWIIKGVKGEFYPCKPDIFEQTYEEV